MLQELSRSGRDIWVTAERVHHPRRPEAEPELLEGTLADLAAITEMLAGAHAEGAA